MQKLTSKYAALGILTVLICGASCLGKSDVADFRSLLAQARKTQDVWTEGTPAVRLQTEIEFVDAGGKTTPAKYIVTWICIAC